jgi:hypothetical protein
MAQLQEIQFNISATDVTLTTTSETVIISSGLIAVPYETARVLIFACAQLTTGTGTTGVTARIRRGTAVGGTLVGEANVEQIKAAVGNTEPFFILASDEQSPAAAVEYSLTLQQAAATGNGTALRAGIVVLVF